VDVTPNRVKCEVCYAPVDDQDFVLCVSCNTPYHAECRRSKSKCEKFGCSGISTMTSKDYVAGAGRELPSDDDGQVKVLLTRRTAQLDAYKMGNFRLMLIGLAYFGVATVFAAYVAIFNAQIDLFFGAIVLFTIGAAMGMKWIQDDDFNHYNRMALIDLELGAHGRNWDGSAKPK
jgi:hypothetical protein